jgi:hypothetical protein
LGIAQDNGRTDFINSIYGKWDMSFIVVETYVGPEYAAIVTDQDCNNFLFDHREKKRRQKPSIAKKE